MRSLRRLFLLIAWLLLALPGLLALAPADWPGVGWARRLVAATPLVGETPPPRLPEGDLLRAWQEGTLQSVLAAQLPPVAAPRPSRPLRPFPDDARPGKHGATPDRLIARCPRGDS